MKKGDLRYELSDKGGAEIDSTATVKQGFIETSNVNVVREMTEMIKINRHYDTASKAIKAYKTMDEKANAVGSSR